MFSCPIVVVILYLGCFVDCDGIAANGNQKCSGMVPTSLNSLFMLQI